MTILEQEFSRRDFLKGTGALVVTFSVPRYLVPTRAAAIGPARVDPSLIDSWIAIGGDGHVTVFTGKEELGQGVATASLQMVADELDVAMSRMTLIQPDTWLTVDQGYSSGSQSLKTEYRSGLRIAAAAARRALLDMAAPKLGMPVSRLAVTDGVVSVQGDPSKSISYAELIGNSKFHLKITGRAKIEGKDFEATASTRPVWRKLFPHLPWPPEEQSVANRQGECNMPELNVSGLVIIFSQRKCPEVHPSALNWGMSEA